MLNTNVVTASSTTIRRNQRHITHHIFFCINHPELNLNNSLAVVNTHRASIQTPVINMGFLHEHQRYRAIKSSTWIPTTALFLVLQMNTDV